MKRTPPFSPAAIRNALLAGTIPFAFIAVAAASYLNNQIRLRDCNNGKTLSCYDVFDGDQAKITNKKYLADRKRLEDEKAVEAARQIQEESRRKAAQAEAKANAERNKTFWEYTSSTDAASGGSYRLATVSSKNQINLDFPYSGEQRARLVLRRHPRYGLDAYLAIEQGQILCNSYTNTSVLLRADNGPVQQFECGEPADNSSETVFIRNFSRVEQLIKGAKTLYVTVTLYQAGDQTFEFPVQNYDASRV